MPNQNSYTCADYREEMMLLGLKKRLQAGELDLSDEEKASIRERIAALEESMGLQ